ncbi:hypothetical protein D9758_017570 [Tetrapyrgos nigripes]|uniref:Uncharacterized protein n=1 Tax=Tetrapyrgos nigripes TaxID=182062 RepID=A0A8H5C3C8_9AGAR|nr:hypothetical protein D9758_017570 [Tetrapyrgos nigripes]
MRKIDLLGGEGCWGGMKEIEGMREVGVYISNQRKALMGLSNATNPGGGVAASTAVVKPEGITKKVDELPWCTYEWYNLPTTQEARILEERQQMVERQHREEEERRVHSSSRDGRRHVLSRADREQGGIEVQLSVGGTASGGAAPSKLQAQDLSPQQQPLQ